MNARLRNRRLRWPSHLSILGMFAAMLLVAGCKDVGKSRPSTAINDNTRTELNVGYSLLYQQANGIPKMDWILTFKDKPEVVEQTVNLLTDHYQQLSRALEDIAAKFPAVRLDADTMPELLADTRKAIGLDMAKDFAPLAGKSGPRFERELLLMYQNALEEQRHLVGVMIERETEPGLLGFLKKTKAQLEERHSGVRQLLDRHYFRPAAE